MDLPPGDAARSNDPLTARAWLAGLATAAEIAAACTVDLGFERYRFPGFEVPAGKTPFSHLAELCHAGARRRYHPLTPVVLSQLSHELAVIERTGLAEFFLICWDLMRFARDKRIPAQGRGSAADSIVAYVLGITRVDPIRHNLLFERFINEGRTSYPRCRHRLLLGAPGRGHPVRLRQVRPRAHRDGLQRRHLPCPLGRARGRRRPRFPAAPGRSGGQGARDV